MAKHRTDRRRDNAIDRIKMFFPEDYRDEVGIILGFLSIDTLEVVCVRQEEYLDEVVAKLYDHIEDLKR